MRANEFISEEINPDVLDTRFSHTQEINGYTYTAALEPDRFHKADLFVIRCYDDGKMIGQAKFYTTFGDSLVSALTTVQPAYQKSGIASTMYAYARMLGNTIEPSASQLPPGKKMWKAWKKSGDANHLMKEEELIEAATAIVYHYAGVSAAAKILTSGVFQLSSVTGNKSEEQYSLPGHPYFLSTTRSKVGDYHRFTGNSAVMFVLDGNWLNQRYKTKPVDYWDRSWNYPNSDRTSESEDRVFSKTDSMPIDGITAVHVLLKEQQEYRSPEVRTILIAAKKRGLPAYLYTDETAWRLQDTRKAVSPAAAAPVLKGQQQKGYTPSRPVTMYLEPWLELIYKKSKAELSPRAEKLRHDLVYYGSRYPGEDSNLGVDMSNARKPNSTDYPTAVKLNDYMRKNNFANTVALKNALVAKWDKIN
jgi:hypothetical protein